MSRIAVAEEHAYYLDLILDEYEENLIPDLKLEVLSLEEEIDKVEAKCSACDALIGSSGDGCGASVGGDDWISFGVGGKEGVVTTPHDGGDDHHEDDSSDGFFNMQGIDESLGMRKKKLAPTVPSTPGVPSWVPTMVNYSASRALATTTTKITAAATDRELKRVEVEEQPWRTGIDGHGEILKALPPPFASDRLNKQRNKKRDQQQRALVKSSGSSFSRRGSPRQPRQPRQPRFMEIDSCWVKARVELGVCTISMEDAFVGLGKDSLRFAGRVAKELGDAAVDLQGIIKSDLENGTMSRVVKHGKEIAREAGAEGRKAVGKALVLVGRGGDKIVEGSKKFWEKAEEVVCMR